MNDKIDPRIGSLVVRLHAPDGPAAAAAIREELFGIAYERMQSLAHRMIRGFPQVRRWDDTADVVQAAGLRLHRALATVDLQDARHLLRLVALQIRRELIDLSRKYSSPESFAVRHETNALVAADGVLMRTDLKADEAADPADGREAWDRFHEAVDGLAADEREIFDMVWFLGATQHDIAALTGSSPRTVRRQWDSIKRRIVVAVGDEMPS